MMNGLPADFAAYCGMVKPNDKTKVDEIKDGEPNSDILEVSALAEDGLRTQSQQKDGHVKARARIQQTAIQAATFRKRAVPKTAARFLQAHLRKTSRTSRIARCTSTTPPRITSTRRRRRR